MVMTPSKDDSKNIGKRKCICGVDADKPHSITSNGGRHGLVANSAVQPPKNTDELESILEQLLPEYERGTYNGDAQINLAKSKLQALILKECTKARIDALKYIEQFAQKQDIDWDFIANMLNHYERELDQQIKELQ